MHFPQAPKYPPILWSSSSPFLPSSAKVKRSGWVNENRWISGKEIKLFPFQLPKVLDKVVNEVELAIIIGKSCNNVTEEEAMDYVGGYCLALDLTGMCIIFKNRDKGLPWDLGKCFDTATGVGRFVSKEELPNPDDVHLKCWVNGELRQSQSTSNMVFSVSLLGVIW